MFRTGRECFKNKNVFVDYFTNDSVDIDELNDVGLNILNISEEEGSGHWVSYAY